MSNFFPSIIRNLAPLQRQQVRYLPRWSHRRPVRVIPAEDYDGTRDIQIRRPKPPVEPVKEEPNVKINWKQSREVTLNRETKNFTNKPKVNLKASKPLTISKVAKPKKATVDMLEATIDNEGGFIYTKMENNDSRVSSILVEIKSKKEKDSKDLILLEGKRVIKDALDAGCKLEYILFSRIKEVEYLRESLPKIGAKLYKMPYREMQLWSDLTTNPGIMGIFKIPDTESYKPRTNIIPLTVICDNVREPTNLGAILRTCSGVGCDSVMLTKGCVNVWDSKVLRSASGAHFKLHITKRLDWNDIREKLPPHSHIYIADNKKLNLQPDDDSSIENLGEILQSVPLVPYYGVDFRLVPHVVLIIGGETEGISGESYRLASEFKGVRLNVPLSNGVDSLNTSTALGVIVFEVKRQLKCGDVEHDYVSSEC